MSYDYSYNRCYKKTFTIINHKVSIRYSLCTSKNTSKCKKYKWTNTIKYPISADNVGWNWYTDHRASDSSHFNGHKYAYLIIDLEKVAEP